jgi:hypothetical protein
MDRRVLMKVMMNNNNQKGIALLMVLGSIAILVFLLAQFTFDSKLNKLKVFGMQDKVQAKLNAEAGLKFALAKMKIYQKGRNLIEENENIKNVLSLDKLEAVLTLPFMFPVPIPKDANIIQRKAAEEFVENTLINGSLRVEMSSVSGFLNPNTLRIKIDPKKDSKSRDSTSTDEDDDKPASSPNVYIEKKLVETLTSALEKKREDDPEFDALYGNLDPVLLIKELKFYVNDPKNFNDPERGEIESRYSSENITPKHAPLTSISEMYNLLGWDDVIVDLI